MQPELSIILPCYNPVEKWMERVEMHLRELKLEVPAFEIIIVNDGSNRGFEHEKAARFFSKYAEVKFISYGTNHGKGYALREGVRKANGELIIYTDIDFPYTRDSFQNIYTALKAGKADVVVGIRDENYYTHLSSSRKRISKLLRFFIKKFLRIPTDDTQCGLKGFNQSGKEAFLKTAINRYLFDLEFIFIASRNRLRIVTENVTLRDEVELSNMRPGILLQESFNFIRIFGKSLINN